MNEKIIALLDHIVNQNDMILAEIQNDAATVVALVPKLAASQKALSAAQSADTPKPTGTP